MRLYYLIIIFFYLQPYLSAQNFEIGVMGGGSLLVGDYPSYSFANPLKILVNPGFGVFLRKPINTRLGLKGSLYITSFSGDDRIDPVNLGLRNPSSFKYPVIELQITADYSLIAIPIFSKPIELYLLGGLGFTKTSINSVVTESSCPVVNLSIPLGMGVRTVISDQLTLFAQGEYVQGLNDCLEGYIGPTGTKDLYGSIKVGVTYLIAPAYSGIGKTIGCPRF